MYYLFSGIFVCMSITFGWPLTTPSSPSTNTGPSINCVKSCATTKMAKKNIRNDEYPFVCRYLEVKNISLRQPKINLTKKCKFCTPNSSIIIIAHNLVSKTNFCLLHCLLLHFKVYTYTHSIISSAGRKIHFLKLKRSNFLNKFIA